MILRLVVATIILVLALVAALVSFAKLPPEPPLLLDAQSPGPWHEYAQTKQYAAPHMLVAPCPITPQNVPSRPTISRT